MAAKSAILKGGYRRRHTAAKLADPGAARVKLATRGPIAQAADFSHEGWLSAPAGGIGVRLGGDQGGCVGMGRAANTAAVGPVSTNRPMYMIAVLSLTWRTTARLWVMMT